MRRAQLGTLLLIASLAVAPKIKALTIDPSFDPSLSALPGAAGIEHAFDSAVAPFSSMFSNPVTINLSVGWGVLDGQAMPAEALGESQAALLEDSTFTYTQIKAWLIASAKTDADRLAYASLPATNPLGTDSFVLTSAQAKVLGLIDPLAGLDGYVALGGSPSQYALDRSDMTNATFDFTGVVQHEVSEVLGRLSGLWSASPAYATAEDLFRFAAPADRSFDYAAPAYFSVDGGATALARFNDLGGGDRGDWLSPTSPTDSAQAYTLPGTENDFSTVDQLALDVVGWGSTGTGASGQLPPTILGNASLATVPEPGSHVPLAAGLLAAALGGGYRALRRGRLNFRRRVNGAGRDRGA